MQDTLVINKHWRPVAFTTWQNAIKLWSEGVAYIVKEDTGGRMLHSQHLTMPVPRVICVPKKWNRRKKLVIPCSRRNVLIRDNALCQYCGKFLTVGDYTMDHVTPECQGGGTTWTNLVAACLVCNGTKGGKTPLQAGMKLARVPVEPQVGDPRFVYKLQISKLRPEWTDWASLLFTSSNGSEDDGASA